MPSVRLHAIRVRTEAIALQSASVSDVDEIRRRTLALYSRSNDEKDSTAWPQLWTENGAVTDRSGTYVRRGRSSVRGWDQRKQPRLRHAPLLRQPGDRDQRGTQPSPTPTSWSSRGRPIRCANGPWATSIITIQVALPFAVSAAKVDQLVRGGSTWLFLDRRIDPRPTIRTRQAGASNSRQRSLLRARQRACRSANDQAVHGAAIGTRTCRSQYATCWLNTIIAVDGDSADQLRLPVLEKLNDEPWFVLHVGCAHDRLVREDRAWRFASKEK